ncbi:hypothetical protein BDF19DRAFT_419868 [Syncephalis fuscata]|nr:hypothetical protein BDF19DRAFT_419868 [Syncephalis fuscata]
MGKLSLFRKKSTSSLRDESVDSEERVSTAPPALPLLNIGSSRPADSKWSPNNGNDTFQSSLASPPKSPLDTSIQQSSLLDEIFSDLSLSSGLTSTTREESSVNQGRPTSYEPLGTSSAVAGHESGAGQSTLMSFGDDISAIMDSASHLNYNESSFSTATPSATVSKSTRQGKQSSKSHKHSSRAKKQDNEDSEFIDIYRKAAANAPRTRDLATSPKKDGSAIRSSVTTVYAAGAKQPKSRKADKRASWRKQSENAARARAATFAAGRFADESKAYGEEDSEEEEDEETTSSDYTSSSSESEESDAEQSDAGSDASVSSGGAGLNRIGQIAVARGLARQAERDKASRIQHWAGTVEKIDNGNLAIERMKDRHRLEMEAVGAVPSVPTNAPLVQAGAPAGPTGLVNPQAGNTATRAPMTRHATTGVMSVDLMRTGTPVGQQQGTDAAVNAIHDRLADARGFNRKHSLPLMNSNAGDNSTLLNSANNGNRPSQLSLVSNNATAFPGQQQQPSGSQTIPVITGPQPLSPVHMQIDANHRVLASSTSTVSTGATPSSAASSVSSSTAPDTIVVDKTRRTSAKGRLQQIPSSDEEDDEEDDDDDDDASDDEAPIAGNRQTVVKKASDLQRPNATAPVASGIYNARLPSAPRSPPYQQVPAMEHHYQPGMPNVASMPQGQPMQEAVYAPQQPPLTLIQQQQQMAAAAQQAKLQQQQQMAAAAQMWSGNRNNGAIANPPLSPMQAYPSPSPPTAPQRVEGVRTQPAGFVRPGQPTLLQQQQMLQQQQQHQMQEQFNARLSMRVPPQPQSPPYSGRNPAQRTQHCYSNSNSNTTTTTNTTTTNTTTTTDVATTATNATTTAINAIIVIGPLPISTSRSMGGSRIQPLISGFSQSPLSGQ